MKPLICSGLLFLLACSVDLPLNAHPGSGIVIGPQEEVYFVDTGFGIWKFINGELVAGDGPAWHWLAKDNGNKFSPSQKVRVPEGDIEIVGRNPTLVVSSSFPVTVGADGSIYYPEVAKDGAVQIMRLSVSGRKKLLARLPSAQEQTPDGKMIQAKWVHGLAADQQGSLYYTERKAVKKISPDGAVSTFSGTMVPPSGKRNPLLKEENFGPGLYGLDAASDGSVYVAASAWCAVLKITPDGSVSVVLQAESPWAATGVAVSNENLYVLEYYHIATQNREDWLPRVRKVVLKTGAVSTLVEVSKAMRGQVNFQSR